MVLINNDVGENPVSTYKFEKEDILHARRKEKQNKSIISCRE